MFDYLGVNDKIKFIAKTNLDLRETKKIEDQKSNDEDSNNISHSSGEQRLMKSMFNQSQSEL